MANMTLTKTPMPEQDANVRNHNFKEVTLGYTAEMAIEEAGRCLHCKKPKCVEGCPVNIHIPEFIAKVAEGGKAVVSVQNTGKTIPPDELPLLFERFHKADRSRSADRESWGLGLYIVKTILDAHGEDIRAESHDGVTTFRFTLSVVR